MAVQITPAILIDNAEQVKILLERYIAAGFQAVDIDIQETPFVETPTVDFAAAAAAANEVTFPSEFSLGWDLKVAEPAPVIAMLLERFPRLDQRFYVYAQADFTKLPENIEMRLGLLANDQIDQPLEYYQQFVEVQIMSIAHTAQGSNVEPQMLNKINQLRDLGYTGTVSIDGGIHPESIALIKPFLDSEKLQRLSVGSYFQTCDTVAEVQSALQTLTELLN